MIPELVAAIVAASVDLDYSPSAEGGEDFVRPEAGARCKRQVAGYRGGARAERRGWDYVGSVFGPTRRFDQFSTLRPLKRTES